jgi:hypothetical protein
MIPKTASESFRVEPFELIHFVHAFQELSAFQLDAHSGISPADIALKCHNPAPTHNLVATVPIHEQWFLRLQQSLHAGIL